MVKYLFTFLLFALAATPAAAQEVLVPAQAGPPARPPAQDAAPVPAPNVTSCDSWPDVPVNVTPEFDEPQYDFSQNLAQIQALASDTEHSIPQYHAITLGITSYEPTLEFHMPVVIAPLPDGLVCAYVQHVDVTIGYKDVTVFVANEIPADSCGFNETLEHEKKHIAVNRALLDEFVPIIEARFKSYLKLNGVFRVEHANYAEQVMQERLSSIMDELIDKMNAENVRRQRDVDSPEEYNRLSNVCGGVLYQIAEQYRLTGK